MARPSARPSLSATPRDLIAGTAIITLFGTTSAYIPVLGFAGFFLLPLPVLFYRVRFGGQAALIVSAVSLLIISGVTGGFGADAALMAGMMGLGFLLGQYLENDTPADKTIAYSTLTILAAAFVAIVVIGNLAGTGPFGLISGYIEKNLELMVAAYKQLDVSEEAIRAIDESMGRLHYALMAVFPAIIAATLIITAWVNLLLGRFILKTAGFTSPALERLNLWQAPEQLVWGVIACGILLLLPFQPMRVIAANILMVAIIVYLLQGFAVISFYFDKKDVPLFIRIIVYAAVAIQQFLLLFVVGVGFFDTWFNLRRINTGDNDQPVP